MTAWDFGGGCANVPALKRSRRQENEAYRRIKQLEADLSERECENSRLAEKLKETATLEKKLRNFQEARREEEETRPVLEIDAFEEIRKGFSKKGTSTYSQAFSGDARPVFISARSSEDRMDIAKRIVSLDSEVSVLRLGIRNASKSRSEKAIARNVGVRLEFSTELGEGKEISGRWGDLESSNFQHSADFDFNQTRWLDIAIKSLQEQDCWVFTNESLSQGNIRPEKHRLKGRNICVRINLDGVRISKAIELDFENPGEGHPLKRGEFREVQSI